MIDNRRFPLLALSVLAIGLIAIIAVLFLSSPILHAATTTNSVKQTQALANQCVAEISPDLKVAEVEEWSYNFYVRVQDESTGINAFELLVD
ncbi:MAG: hypothetical protein QG670_1274, partial [Thermoproteota archaeon]|nr:hypothetical protein [Thermoproteota archaeon]